MAVGDREYFEPQGQGVPAGGTTGQVLAKVTDTDRDVAWIDPATGGSAGTPATTVETEAFGDAGQVGVSTNFAREDHRHPMPASPDLSGYAHLASPALTGTPTAPTATPGTNTTQVASTGFVAAAVAQILDTAPGTLDTLKELADALGDDPNFAATVATSIGTKVTSNGAIAGGTGTKITYDAKGLVTSSAAATTADIADSADKRYVTDAQRTVIGNTTGTNSGNETAGTVGTILMGVATKAAPVDADTTTIMDSAAGNALKMLSWANIKATLKTYFDTLYQAAGTYLTSGGALGTPSSGTLTNCTFPTLNQNTNGTAANLSGTPALPDGVTATTQTVGDSSTKLATTAFVIANAGGGSGASDLLSTLTAAEISVTGATTATIGRMHVCTGTSADYTVTLPAVSGNAKKLIGFRMASALTKLVTLDGNSAETIDGALTRVMWANEVAILFCDGVTWTKIAGKSVPFTMSTYSGANTTGTTVSTFYKVSNSTLSGGNTNYSAACDLANSKIIIPRTSKYIVMMSVIDSGANTSARTVYSKMYQNGGGGGQNSQYTGASLAANPVLNSVYGLTAADYIEQYVSFTAGSYTSNIIINSGYAGMTIVELPTW